MRFVQWKADREAKYDSFFRADSIRHEQWKIERQAKWDSMRKADSLWRDSVGMKYFAPRVKKDTILDLNHCDTAELQLIRGIGRYTASQIVQYRERLGGFYSPEQLKDEVFGKLSLDTLLYRFTADSTAVQRMDVNRASIDRLQRHPYIRYEQAKAIYTLRRKKVRLESIEDLRALPEMTEEDLRRAAPSRDGGVAADLSAREPFREGQDSRLQGGDSRHQDCVGRRADRGGDARQDCQVPRP